MHKFVLPFLYEREKCSFNVGRNMSYKPILLPIAADLSGQMFSMEYELRPLHIKADQSLKMTVRPVEIFYDQVLL